VDAAAKVTSKGQVTVPKAVRDALGIKAGDEVVFRVEGNRALSRGLLIFSLSLARSRFLPRSATRRGTT
jgi:AbrB family looped-hinge helix DNA binding protein